MIVEWKVVALTIVPGENWGRNIYTQLCRPWATYWTPSEMMVLKEKLRQKSRLFNIAVALKSMALRYCGAFFERSTKSIIVEGHHLNARDNMLMYHAVKAAMFLCQTRFAHTLMQQSGNKTCWSIKTNFYRPRLIKRSRIRHLCHSRCATSLTYGVRKYKTRWRQQMNLGRFGGCVRSQVICLRKNCFQLASKLLQSPFTCLLPTTLHILSQIWKVLYGHKYHIFLNHLVEFLLNCTSLNNLNIWFS